VGEDEPIRCLLLLESRCHRCDSGHSLWMGTLTVVLASEIACMYIKIVTPRRFSFKARMPSYSALPVICVVLLSMFFASPKILCQEPASDSGPTAPADSQTGLADSVYRNGTLEPTSDTLRPTPSDTPGERNRPADQDTLRPKGDADTTNGSTDSSKKAEAGAVLSAPTDSVLTAACTGPSGSASVARDLLVVVFTPEAGKQDRAAAAKRVAGKLVGPVSSQPGAYYLRVPTEGQEFRLRAAADELAQLAQVQQVGSRACPPPSPSGKLGPSGRS
jgi:hypothetical protein